MVLLYSLILTISTESLYRVSKYYWASWTIPIHIEILLPAFCLGMITEEHGEEHDEEHEEGKKQNIYDRVKVPNQIEEVKEENTSRKVSLMDNNLKPLS